MSTITLPQNLLTNAGTLRQDFESLDGWTALKGSMALDAVNFKTGVAGIETTGAADFGRIQLDLGVVEANQWDFSNSNQFRIWYYIADLTGIGTPALSFWDAATGTKSAIITLQKTTGWNLAVLQKADFTLASGFSWSEKIRYFRIQYNVTAGAPVITWDSFYSHVISQAAICITLDDADLSMYNVAHAYMHDRNIHGTFFVRSGLVNTAGCVTTAQILEMEAAGDVIGNHTREHTDLEATDYAGALAAINNGKNDLLGLGITNPYHLAYPGGAYDADAIQAAQDAGMLTARTVSSALTTGAYESYMPWPRPYLIPIRFQADSTKTLADATAIVDAINANGELGVLLFHGLVAAPAGYSWFIDRFQGLIDHIVNNCIPCVTMKNLYDLQSGTVGVTIYDRPGGAAGSDTAAISATGSAAEVNSADGSDNHG